MNNIQMIIEEMEADLSIAKVAIADFDKNKMQGIKIAFMMYKAAMDKYIPMLKLLLTAETQTTVKKPEA